MRVARGKGVVDRAAPTWGTGPVDELTDALKGIWSETRGDDRICVAVLDGPVDLMHEAFRNARLAQLTTPFSTGTVPGPAARHGTQVASVIFGQHEGPVKGIAPGCRGLIIPLFADGEGRKQPSCSQADVARAVESAMRAGAHVVNISAGEMSNHASLDPRLERAVLSCAEAGVLVVAAAGDDGCAAPRIPGALPTVLAVGGTARRPTLGGQHRYADGHGACLVTRGSDILGAVPGGALARDSGTSFAAAIVSGVAALLLSLLVQRGRAADVELVRNVLLGSATARSEGTAGGPSGRLDVDHARMLLEQALLEQAQPQPTSAGAGRPAQPRPVTDERDVIGADALRARYRDTTAGNFGTVDIELPDGRTYNVDDLRYPVADGRRGMRLLPASDDTIAVPTDGRQLPGYGVVDDMLRREMGLRPAEPIYALISYFHADERRVALTRLLHSRKLQMGHRHLAAYVGRGRTTHVLPRHTTWRGDGPTNMRLNLDRYPATLHMISLHGVPQRTLNRNAHIVDHLVATLARSPEQTEKLSCRTIDLSTTLQYYRDLIRGADYLEDLAWRTNCSVHKAIVVNLMVNVPHNPRAFLEIFGPDGEQLWDDFRRRYHEVTGDAFGADAETRFTPLWQLAGLNPRTIRPLSSREYHAFHASRAEGWLAEYDGPRPPEPGVGLAWCPETVPDLLNAFIRTYLPLEKAGGLLTAGLLLQLRHLATEKLRISEQHYLDLVAPLITTLLVTDLRSARSHGAAATRRDVDAILAWVTADDQSGPQWCKTDVRGVLQGCLDAARDRVAEVTSDDPHAIALSAEEALAGELDRLRAAMPALGTEPPYFTSPSIMHQLALGRHPSSPFVQVRALCTVLDQSEPVPQPSPD
jgi:subtilisin family serine protease